MDPFTAFFYALWGSLEVGGIAFSNAALTVLAYASTVAVMTAGSMLLNRAMAPSIDDTAGGGIALMPQTTQDEGVAVQEVYGVNRCHVNIVGSYVQIPTTNELILGKDLTRRIKGCFGEGPWSATPASSSILINQRPISDFSDVVPEWKLGTVDQTALTGWSAHRQDYQIGQVLSYGSPVTWTLPRAGWDDLLIILAFPRGLIHYGEDDTTHQATHFRVEVGDAIADTWQTLFDGSFQGKTAQPAYVAYQASETYDGGSAYILTEDIQPRVRVTQTIADSTSSRHIRDIEVFAVQVVKYVGFTHPGRVMLGLSLVPDEATSGGVTELSCVSTGKVVVDEDGNFGVTRSAADIIRDILTQPVIEGDGSGTAYSASYYRGLDTDRLIGTGWSSQKDLADELVPDGGGNQDYLLRCDAIFSSASNAHAAIRQICASNRCGLYWRGRDIGLWVEDGSKTPVGILCDGSLKRDSLTLTPIESDELASSGTATYRDDYADYEQRPVRVVDNTLSTLAQVDLQLAAVTRSHDAARLLRRELARNWLVDLTGSGQADLDSMVYEAGDVVYVQIDGKSLGGRVVAVSDDGRTLTADRDLTDIATGDDAAAVVVIDPATGRQSVEDQTATLIGTRQIRVPADWTIDPVVGAAFLFGPATITSDWFEIGEIALDQQLNATLKLSKYVTDQLDALDATAPDIEVPLGNLTGNAYGGIRRRYLDGDALDAAVTTEAVTYEGEYVTYDGETVYYG